MRAASSLTALTLLWSFGVIWRLTPDGLVNLSSATAPMSGFVCPEGPPPPPPPPPIPDPVPLAVAVLQRASEVIVPNDGDAPETLAWQMIEADARADSIWIELGGAQSPAARIYALRGLVWTDPVRSARLAQELRQQPDVVTIRRGDVVQVLPMARAVERAGNPEWPHR